MMRKLGKIAEIDTNIASDAFYDTSIFLFHVWEKMSFFTYRTEHWKLGNTE